MAKKKKKKSSKRKSTAQQGLSEPRKGPDGGGKPAPETREAKEAAGAPKRQPSKETPAERRKRLDRLFDKFVWITPAALSAVALLVVLVVTFTQHRPYRGEVAPEDVAEIESIEARLDEIGRHEIPRVQRFSKEFITLEEERAELKTDKWKIEVKYKPNLPPPWEEYQADYVVIVRPIFFIILAFFIFRVGAASGFYFFIQGDREARHLASVVISIGIGGVLYWLVSLDAVRIIIWLF